MLPPEGTFATGLRANGGGVRLEYRTGGGTTQSELLRFGGRVTRALRVPMRDSLRPPNRRGRDREVGAVAGNLELPTAPSGGIK